jgi:hypothetical protein
MVQQLIDDVVPKPFVSDEAVREEQEIQRSECPEAE